MIAKYMVYNQANNPNTRPRPPMKTFEFLNIINDGKTNSQCIRVDKFLKFLISNHIIDEQRIVRVFKMILLDTKSSRQIEIK